MDSNLGIWGFIPFMDVKGRHGLFSHLLFHDSSPTVYFQTWRGFCVPTNSKIITFSRAVIVSV